MASVIFHMAKTLAAKDSRPLFAAKEVPMLNIGNEKVPLCSGVSRRSFLQAGSAGLAGMTLPALMNLQARGAVVESQAKIKNCITIFLVGSPGHLSAELLRWLPPAPGCRSVITPSAHRNAWIALLSV